MSVSSDYAPAVYAANGAQVTWDLTFPVILTSDVQVSITSPGDVTTILTDNYDVDLVLARVTYPTTVSALAALASGWTLTLERIVPITQELVLQNQAPFNAESIGTALDKLTMICQQMQLDIDQTPTIPTDSNGLTFPTPETGKAVGWAADGTLTNIDVTTVGGLGTMSTQSASAVAITGGTITGITDIAIADGGTGQSTAQLAINALTAVGAATNEHVLTRDTSSGNAIWKIVPTGLLTNASTVDYQTSLTNQFVFGATSGISTARVSIDGGANVKQLVVQGHSTQTAAIFEVQKSDATAALSVSNTAGTTFGGTTSRVKDTNGLTIIALSAAASAVNWISIANGATGNNASITATGESNVGLDLISSGTKSIRTTKAHHEKEVTLTDGATPAIDLAGGNVFILVAAGDRTIAVGSNPPVAGYSYKAVVKHTASAGARTLAFNTAAGGWAYGSDFTGPSQTASGKTDIFPCIWDHTIGKMLVLGQVKGY